MSKDDVTVVIRYDARDECPGRFELGGIVSREGDRREECSQK